MKWLFLMSLCLLLTSCVDIEENYNWECEEITCGKLRLTNAKIECGNYHVWEHRCEMINCSKRSEEVEKCGSLNTAK